MKSGVEEDHIQVWTDVIMMSDEQENGAIFVKFVFCPEMIKTLNRTIP